MFANPLATVIDLKKKYSDAPRRVSMTTYNRELDPELKPYYKLESRPVPGKPLMYEKQAFTAPKTLKKRNVGGRRTRRKGMRKSTLKKRRGGK